MLLLSSARTVRKNELQQNEMEHKNVLRLPRRAAGKKTDGTHGVEEKFFKGLFLTGGSDGGIME